MAKTNGAYYTPDSLARFVANKLLDYACAGSLGSNQLVLDPACGDGQLLGAINDAASSRLMSCCLVGSDIDPVAIRAAQENLPSAQTLTCDALGPDFDDTVERTWQRRLASFGLQQPTMCIANPPWGADLRLSTQDLMGHGYSLARGQYDSYELFVEMALRVVATDGLLAFIVPDSLFAAEHEALREMLLDRTQLLYVARMGEGIFESVFRGCVVFICRNATPKLGDATQCMHLTPEWRKAILSGATTFAEAEASLLHQVPTARFRQNSGKQIDIDAREADTRCLGKLRSTRTTMAHYLSSARGVELSKHGRVVHCQVCDLWSPAPKDDSCCPRCGQDILPLSHDVIVSRTPAKGYLPFIVGEDIGRHQINSHRWLAVSRKGINYKDSSLYEGKKLLVRKTGVGISAAMDYSGALTNQVVYVFKRSELLPTWVPIEFAAALICSRAAYYHLAVTNGEMEWRSHPYLTQRHVLDLPAPDPDRLAGFRADIEAVAAMIRRDAVGGLSIETDIAAERLVAHVFGLVRSDYELIFDTIYAVQDLAPIRAMKSVRLEDLF